MAMEIPYEKIRNPELLTEQEIWYLFTRGRLPKGVEAPSQPPSKDPKPFPGEISKVTPLEEQSVPSIGDQGGIVDDNDDETYEDGWTNDQRRAELSRRGLSIDGKKQDLIDRLLRSDSDTLDPDDYDQV